LHRSLPKGSNVLTTKLKRKIIKIDEDKCDGCGICADACHEGAIRIIDGKARLVSESYCDGLGDCLGPCPRDAISIEVREADAYDEEAVQANLSASLKEPCPPSGCPGSMARKLVVENEPGTVHPNGSEVTSRLTTWPVQIRLLPVNAPYFSNADILIAADCTALACPDFHERFLAGGKVVMMGCPKLDDSDYIMEKLTEIFRSNDVRSINVVYMEVPCCGGLVRLVHQALAESGRKIPFTLTKLGINGHVIDTVRL